MNLIWICVKILFVSCSGLIMIIKTMAMIIAHFQQREPHKWLQKTETSSNIKKIYISLTKHPLKKKLVMLQLTKVYQL